MVVPKRRAKRQREPIRQPTEDDYRAIELTLKIAVSDGNLRRGLKEVCETANWYAEQEHDPSKFKATPYSKALHLMRAHAEKLLRDVTSPTGKPNDQSEKAWAYEHAQMAAFGEVLVEPLKEFISNVNITLEQLTGKGGRPQDQAFEVLLGRLAELYETTGKRAGVSYRGKYSGPFFHFVKICLTRLAPAYNREDDALGKAIQRNLRKRE